MHQLLLDRIQPFRDYADRGEKVPKRWAWGGMHRFLYSDADMRGRIAYVEKNPSYSRLVKQTWSFVLPYP